MKKKLIHAGVLIIVFMIAVLFFEFLTSRGNDNMMEDIGNATLPRVFFSVDGYGLNSLNPYVKEMDITTMRGTITPVSNGQIQVNVESKEREVESLEYAVCTIDGKTELFRDSLDSIGEQAALTIGEELLVQERMLVITLHTNEGEVYYYTRVIDPTGFSLTTCLDYVYRFHENALAKNEDSGIGTAIEPSDEGDNTTFSHVTINSDYDHVTWGDLEPQVVGGERWKLMETNANFTSVLLEYEVSCKGEENETDLYTVKEFFRVRTVGENTYLLNYDRTMEQLFDGSKQVLSEKGVLLGITGSNVQYVVNDDGTIVSFVQANELWSYNRDTDEMSLLFSFRDAENTDVRNKVSDHEIQILDMDEKGNTTFAVTGYMNRGTYEGLVGCVIYYYSMETNSIEEKAFIESDKCAEVAREELGQLVYYSTQKNRFYALIGGVLHEMDLEEDTEKELVEGLQEGLYAVSEDGSKIAYQSEGDTAGQTIVMDLSSGKKYQIEAEQGERVVPLGFVGEDFVSGVSREADAGTTAIGEAVTPMYKIEIRDPDNQVVKSYEEEGFWVTDVKISDGMIALSRVVRNGNVYEDTEADYIASSEEKKESNISLESYYTDLKETQIRLTYVDGIQDRNPKVLKPKQVKSEDTSTYEFKGETVQGYYVYSLGRFQGVYKKAGDAIAYADKTGGVVVLAATQQYIWERGNRGETGALSGQEALLSSIRENLQNGGTALEVMAQCSENGGLELRGCTTEQMLYFISHNLPVIGLTGQGSVILTSYTRDTITYMDVGTTEQSTVSQEEMDQMISAGGGVFISYIPDIEG